MKERIRDAREWLLNAKPKDTEDRVFHLWSLKLADAEDEAIREAAKELLATQHDDGGWSQTADTDSDAYATGTALVALNEVGALTTHDEAYRRGVRYLLRTQLPDGTWHVKKRAKGFQTYFESGFPHGNDQFISISATSWATAALSLGR